MLFSFHKIIVLFALALFLQGCSTSQKVARIDSNKEISKIYVQKNDKVLREGFHAELLNQLKELGFSSESYSGETPEYANYYMTYTANWMLDIDLNYFKASLYEQGNEPGFSKLIGEVEYDAKMGGGNLNKFGHTADKIRPLLQELFSKVKRNSLQKLPTLE
jgi:hypothetical protein